MFYDLIEQPAPQPSQPVACFEESMPQYDGYAAQENGLSAYGQDEPDYNPEVRQAVEDLVGVMG